MMWPARGFLRFSVATAALSQSATDTCDKSGWNGLSSAVATNSRNTTPEVAPVLVLIAQP